jgi:predicted Zn finger-like uncharacterized protein
VPNRPSDGGEPDRFLQCPRCNAVSVRTESLGRSVVYVRCIACGEVWTIAERRKSVRENDRSARYPPEPEK